MVSLGRRKVSLTIIFVRAEVVEEVTPNSLIPIGTKVNLPQTDWRNLSILLWMVRGFYVLHVEAIGTF